MNLPKRKSPRLKDFDYSSSGAYFITICTQNKACLLSRIVGEGLTNPLPLAFANTEICFSALFMTMSFVKMTSI